MPDFAFDLNFLFLLIRVVAVFGLMVVSVPVLVLAERKIIGYIQQRPGPNRVGPWGLLQTIVDGIKLMLKEDFIPPKAERGVFVLAPMLTLVPAVLAISIVPFGPDLELSFRGEAYTIPLGVSPDLPVGILFYLAATSLGVYGIVLAGWSSNSKYSLLGGIRASAQLISYELTLGLSLIGVFLIVGSFNLGDLLESQSGGFWGWHIWRQPLAFMMFLTAGFAETNRLPFDLPECEGELGAGFHTEYSSMKFAIFFMAEYMAIFTFCAIITTLFLGGYQGPIGEWAFAGIFGGEVPNLILVASGLFWLGFKICALFFFFVWVRATLPRLRYDQLMNLGWKILFPLGVINVITTSGIIAIVPPDFPPIVQGLGLAIAGFGIIAVADAMSVAAKRRVIGNAG